MKKIMLVFSLLLVVMFLVSCTPEVSDEEVTAELEELSENELKEIVEEGSEESGVLVGQARKTIRSIKTISGKEVIINKRVAKLAQVVLENKKDEICTSSCSLSACFKDTNVCENTVLLVGDNFGYLSPDNIKSHQAANYIDGNDACQVMLNKQCAIIEKYVTGDWVDEADYDCLTRTDQYDSSKNYRAVCVGIVMGGIPPPTGSSGSGQVET